MEKGAARWLLDPEEVARYRPGPQGPAPALEVRIGSVQVRAFESSVVVENSPRFTEGARHGSALSGTISNWESIAAIAGTKESARFWRLEPGDTVDEVAFEGFFVRGRFRIVEQINNERQARQAFRMVPTPQSLSPDEIESIAGLFGGVIARERDPINVGILRDAVNRLGTPSGPKGRDWYAHQAAEAGHPELADEIRAGKV